MFHWLLDLLKRWLEPDRSFGAARSPQWPKVRAEHLKLEPCCQVCSTRKSLEVHHCIPVHFHGGKEAELLPNNLITLCRDHHLLIGHHMDFKARNTRVKIDSAILRRAILNREYPNQKEHHVPLP